MTHKREQPAAQVKVAMMVLDKRSGVRRANWMAALGKLSGTGNVGTTSTWLAGTSALAPGEGERQAGGEETSLLVPSSPDSSVTGESSVWQRPAVI